MNVQSSILKKIILFGLLSTLCLFVFCFSIFKYSENTQMKILSDSTEKELQAISQIFNLKINQWSKTAYEVNSKVSNNDYIFTEDFDELEAVGLLSQEQSTQFKWVKTKSTHLPQEYFKIFDQAKLEFLNQEFMVQNNSKDFISGVVKHNRKSYFIFSEKIENSNEKQWLVSIVAPERIRALFARYKSSAKSIYIVNKSGHIVGHDDTAIMGTFSQNLVNPVHLEDNKQLVYLSDSDGFIDGHYSFLNFSNNFYALLYFPKTYLKQNNFLKLSWLLSVGLLFLLGLFWYLMHQFYKDTLVSYFGKVEELVLEFDPKTDSIVRTLQNVNSDEVSSSLERITEKVSLKESQNSMSIMSDKELFKKLSTFVYNQSIRALANMLALKKAIKPGNDVFITELSVTLDGLKEFSEKLIDLNESSSSKKNKKILITEFFKFSSSFFKKKSLQKGFEFSESMSVLDKKLQINFNFEHFNELLGYIFQELSFYESSNKKLFIKLLDSKQGFDLLIGRGDGISSLKTFNLNEIRGDQNANEFFAETRAKLMGWHYNTYLIPHECKFVKIYIPIKLLETLEPLRPS